MNLRGLLNNNKLLEKEKQKKQKEKEYSAKWRKNNPKAIALGRAKSYVKVKRSRLDSCGAFSNGSSSIDVPIDDLFSKDAKD